MKKSIYYLSLGLIGSSVLNQNEQNRMVVEVAPLEYLFISSEFYDELLNLDNLAAQLEFQFAKSISKRFRTVSEAEDIQVDF